MLKISVSALLDPVTNRLKETTSSVQCVPLLSVSINQIIKLLIPQIGLIVHKHLIGMVKVVARVVSKLSEDMFTSFQVTDGTHIDGLKVISYRGSRVDSNTIITDNYYKFFGKIRVNANGSIALVAYSIEPITDFNEISLHCCEIVRETLELRKLKNRIFKLPNVPTASSTTTTTSEVINDSTTFEGQNFRDEPATEDSKRPGDFLSLNLQSGLQSDILNLLVKCEKPEGLSKQEIRDAFPTASLAEVQEAINFLDLEAHIYPTIDEDHFKCVWD